MRTLTYSENGHVLKIEESKDYKHGYSVIFSGLLQANCMTQLQVKLLVEFKDNLQLLYIQDLLGNGYDSGIQGQGTGTLLFNTALQLFQREYPPETSVYGELSNAGDPTDATLALECKERREGFWSSFGFNVTPGGRLGTKMTALLGKLTPKVKDVRICGGFPRFVGLDRFSGASGS